MILANARWAACWNRGSLSRWRREPVGHDHRSRCRTETQLPIRDPSLSHHVNRHVFSSHCATRRPRALAHTGGPVRSRSSHLRRCRIPSPSPFCSAAITSGTWSRSRSLLGTSPRQRAIAFLGAGRWETGPAILLGISRRVALAHPQNAIGRSVRLAGGIEPPDRLRCGRPSRVSLHTVAAGSIMGCTQTRMVRARGRGR